MDFNQLLARMKEIDTPADTLSVTEEPLSDCGPMPSAPSATPSSPPPSMSINLNAQGLDNIEDLMKLIKAVNPDMDKPAGMGPSINVEPMDKPIGMPPMGLSPLKMLPDLDSEKPSHMEPDGDEGPEIKGLDRDGDNDHDMKDHDMEKKDKEEAFGNSPIGGSEPEIKDVSASIPDGNDLNKPKKSFSDKPYRGDNPMAAEGTDLRSQIRAELLRRLAEAKGAK